MQIAKKDGRESLNLLRLNLFKLTEKKYKCRLTEAEDPLSVPFCNAAVHT